MRLIYRAVSAEQFRVPDLHWQDPQQQGHVDQIFHLLGHIHQVEEDDLYRTLLPKSEFIKKKLFERKWYKGNLGGFNSYQMVEYTEKLLYLGVRNCL